MRRRTGALLALWIIAAPSPAPAISPIVCPDKAAAEQGSAVEAYYLGKAYDEGYCQLAADKVLAEKWYRVGAEGGHMLAQYEMGETYFTGDGFPTDFPQAKKWYLAAAKQGHGLSQLRLGFLSAEAHFEGLKPDYAEAEKWFTAAAEQNAGDARFRLGNFYANYKEPRDYTRAYIWLRRAAEGGHRVAMYDLARLFREGKGVTKNEKEAFRWMLKSAEAGVLQAQMAVSDMYATGTGVEKSLAESLKWILKIANSPSAPVAWLNKAGDIFFGGWETIPKNYPFARRFYERAAAKGDTHALEMLAKMYIEGLGVTPDPEKAREYLKKIAH